LWAEGSEAPREGRFLGAFFATNFNTKVVGYEIIDGSLEPFWAVSQESDSCVTASAKSSPYSASSVVMIDRQGLWGITNGTLGIFGFEGIELLWGEAIAQSRHVIDPTFALAPLAVGSRTGDAILTMPLEMVKGLPFFAIFTLEGAVLNHPI